MDTRAVKFAGGPLDGQVREIPDARLFTCVHLPKLPDVRDGMEYEPIEDIIYRRAGRTLEGIDVFVLDGAAA